MNSKVIFPSLILLIFILFYSTVLYADHENNHIIQNKFPQEPEFKIIDKWRGTWNVKAIRHQPQPAMEITYTETSEWILNGQFLSSYSSQKPDGSKTMSLIWFDALTKNFRFMIFDSSGIGIELPPPTWEEDTQTMKWESSIFTPIKYTGYVTFIDQNTIRWKSLLKSGFGNIILDLEGKTTRLK